MGEFPWKQLFRLNNSLEFPNTFCVWFHFISIWRGWNCVGFCVGFRSNLEIWEDSTNVPPQNPRNSFNRISVQLQWYSRCFFSVKRGEKGFEYDSTRFTTAFHAIWRKKLSNSNFNQDYTSIKTIFRKQWTTTTIIIINKVNYF